jgi:uncharacterized cupredoxin-like copper-binding protein
MGGSLVKCRSVFLGCLCLLFVGTLAACGGSGTGSSNQEGSNTVEETTAAETSAAGTTSPAPAQESSVAEGPIETIPVNETEMSLDPTDITLDRPGTYVFRAVNVGNAPHALRIEGNGIEEQQTEEIGPGESADLTVTLDSGTYEMDCPVDDHEDLGMRGTITVQ